MTWDASARMRALSATFTGERMFALVLADGTEYGDSVAGRMSQPARGEDRALRCVNEDAIEFPEFVRSSPVPITGCAIYDGQVRLAVVDVGPLAVTAGEQVVLRAGRVSIGLVG